MGLQPKQPKKKKNYHKKEIKCVDIFQCTCYVGSNTVYHLTPNEDNDAWMMRFFCLWAETAEAHFTHG